MIQEPNDINMLMDDDEFDSLENLVHRDSPDAAGLDALVTIDLDEVDDNASSRAEVITDRLSSYYFDEKYIKEHPYIPTKIMMEMDNIRRLLKMLIVNEKAQDALIKAISLSPGKGTLFISLTAMQKGTLLIQKQLNDLVADVEQIFQKMQDEADKQWSEKDKDTDEDGTMTVRGSREFIKQLQEKYKNRPPKKDSNVEKVGDELVDTETGEVLPSEKTNSDGTPEGATPIADIIG